jgi:hypothetical protein
MPSSQRSDNGGATPILEFVATSVKTDAPQPPQRA